MFSNAGTIHMLGGVLQELTGNGLFPAAPIANLAGGLIQGLGNIVAPITNNGTIEGKFGPNLDINGAITGTGTLQVDQGCVLELGGAVASSQTVTFTGTGETLRIDQPSGFAAQVAGFSAGDVIDVAGSPVTSVAISAGTLVLGTSYGQLRLATTAPLGGEVSAGADSHGGGMVTYTPQLPGSSTVATITVGQPRMLFWASPVGDTFTGVAANMAGATLANWTGADALDMTDMAGAKASVTYTQASGYGNLVVTDGAHADTLTLLGTYTPSYFHSGLDAHGGAVITYGHS